MKQNRSVFLSTRGENGGEVSEKLVKFLEFVRADLAESTGDFADEFVRQLQKSVESVRESREMEERFMILEEMLREERAEGKAEGKAEGQEECILELLEEMGPVPEELYDKIREERDLTVLKRWFHAAVKAESIAHFLESIR